MCRAAYLRAACGVPANPLASSLVDKELGPQDVPVIQCPIRVSLAADAFAVKKLREYRGGAIIQWAWCTSGHVSEAELASWLYDGDLAKMQETMAECKGGFEDLLFMSETPAVDHEAGVIQL